MKEEKELKQFQVPLNEKKKRNMMFGKINPHL